jgi:c-di-GMP-binding flagellar brake protein YcgR
MISIMDEAGSPSTPGAQASPAEKRQHPRIPAHWQAAVMVQQRPSMGKLGDLSRGGLTFLGELNLPIGSKHQFFIRMPTADRTGYHQLEVLAQVCSCSLMASQGLYRVGLRILEMRGNTAEHIMHFLHVNGG